MLRVIMFVLGRIIPAVIGLAAVAVYTRVLSPAAVGTYAFFISQAILFAAVGYTWLRIAALRFSSSEGARSIAELRSGVLAAFVAISIPLCMIEGIFLHAYRPSVSATTLSLALLATIATGWNDLNASIMQAQMRPLAWGRINFLRAILTLGIALLGVRMGLGADAVLIGFAAGNAGSALLVKTWSPAFAARPDPRLIREFFLFGWPQSLSVAQAYLTPAFQRGMLLSLGGPAVLGIFAVSQDFATQTISSLVGAVSLAGIPLAYQAKDAGDDEALATQLKKNAGIILATAIPITAGTIALAGPLSHILFGAKFWEGSSLIVSLVSVAAVFTNLRIYYFDQAFELSKRMHSQAVVSTAGVLFSLGCSAYAIPRFGAAGAAWSLVAGGGLALALSACLGRKEIAMPVPWMDLMKTILATLAMLLVIALFPRPTSVLELGACATACIAAYGAISIVLRRNLTIPRLRVNGEI